MSGTLTQGDYLLWGGFSLVALIGGALAFFPMTEFDRWAEIALRWLGLAGGVAALWTLAFVGWLPGAIYPVLFLVMPAGLTGAALGAVLGVIWHRFR